MYIIRNILVKYIHTNLIYGFLLEKCCDYIRITASGHTERFVANKFGEYVKRNNRTYANMVGNGQFLHRDLKGMWRVCTTYCITKNHTIIHCFKVS